MNPVTGERGFTRNTFTTTTYYLNSTVLGRLAVAELNGSGQRAVRSAGGHTALSAAVSRQASPDVIRLLLQAGADVNHRTKSGETPLTIAEQNGDDATVHLLKRPVRKRMSKDNNNAIHSQIEED